MQRVEAFKPSSGYDCVLLLRYASSRAATGVAWLPLAAIAGYVSATFISIAKYLNRLFICGRLCP